MVIGLLLLLSNVATATEFDIVRPDDLYQDCVSLTVKFCNDNPEYIPCSISNNRYFYGRSHMVAIKIINNETILIHDELSGFDMYGSGWSRDQSTFYHFWIDEPIKRNYKYLLDNREMVLY